jgi:hypothetical protein
MAAPEFVDYVTDTASVNTGEATAYPTGPLQAGDYLLALLTHYDVSFADSRFVVSDDIWQPVSIGWGTAGSVAQVDVSMWAHRMVGATDSGTMAWRNMRGASGDIMGMLAYRNLNNCSFADPDVGDGGEESGTSGTITIATNTNLTGGEGPHLVLYVALSEEPTCDFVWPAECTPRLRIQGGSSVMEVADELVVGSGDWPARAIDWTKTGSGSKDIQVARWAPYFNQAAILS